MTKDEYLKVLAERELARRRLLSFTKYTHPDYQPGWVHADMCARLERFSTAVSEKKSPRLMLLLPPRHGKLLDDFTEVFTDSGWKVHGSLQPGDKVVGLNGEWVNVVAVSEMGLANMEVEIATGVKIVAHPNHEWAVDFLMPGGKRYERRVMETSEMASRGMLRSTRKHKYYIPRCKTHKHPDPSVRIAFAHARKPTNRGRNFIRAIREVEPRPGRCIQVDAMDGIYMVTRHFIPTHNSELASIRFPSWHLGHFPTHEVINVGYNTDLPMSFSRKVRDLMTSRVYKPLFPQTQLDPKSQSVEQWHTTSGGGFLAAGVGGGITGKGAHILIVDDPIKNQEEADSVLVRNKLDEWFQSTAYSRLAPGGGVLIIECMTGDTPVLLSDGAERRLDQIQVGDEVATYEDGKLTTTRVAGWKQSGRDSVLKITTTSGRVVRANGRHPFLVSLAGRLVWIRARSLTTAHKIVALPDSGANGKGCSAPQTGAKRLLSAGGTATSTTTKNGGPTGTALLPSTLSTSVSGTSSTATASPQTNTTDSSSLSVGYARSAETRPEEAPPDIGKTTSVSTTATKQELSGASYVTAATPPSDMLELSALHSPWLNTSEFIVDQVISIEPDGEEDVYDLQIERTENFIANGLVSHNTWWNDDDLAGRLMQRMGKNPEADQYVIVKYPALAEQYEFQDPESLEIIRLPENKTPDPAFKLLRKPGEALHPDRYSEKALNRIRSNTIPRIWSALYQQNPVPDEGLYFTKDMIHLAPEAPNPFGLNVYTAWDLAISTKQTSDYTVGATILQDAYDRLYVVDIRRFRGEALEIVQQMIEVAHHWMSHPGVGYHMGVEDGQIWKAIEPLFRRSCDEQKVFPAFDALRPLTDKLVRARPLQGRMQQKRLFFLDEQAWLQPAIFELLRFPGGQHDDIVDALAWAVRQTMEHSAPQAPTRQATKSWRDKLDSIGRDTDGTHMVA